MIKINATGKIHYISPVQTVGTNGFQKRELVLDDSYTKDGQTFNNYVSIDFSGERMAMLDLFQPGQTVTVEAFLRGNVVTDSKGQKRIMHNVKGMSIVPYVKQQPAQAQQPQGYVNPANGAQYPMQPQQYPSQQTYQQQAPYGQQQPGYSNPQTGLPFD